MLRFHILGAKAEESSDEAHDALLCDASDSQKVFSHESLMANAETQMKIPIVAFFALDLGLRKLFYIKTMYQACTIHDHFYIYYRF